MLGNVLIERSIREAVEIRQGTDRREPLMRIVASVDIDRPASQVWAYVADYGNDPSWRGGVTQMRPSQPGPGQEGVTTRELLRPVGMSFRTDAASTGSSLGACSSGRPGIGRRSCEAPAWLQPLGPLVAWLLRRRATADLGRLKHLLEISTVSGSAPEEPAT